MTNKRIIALISAIIVIVGVFAACNTNTDSIQTVQESTSLTVTPMSEASESYQQPTTIHQGSTETRDVSEETTSEATTKTTTKNSTQKSETTTKKHTTTTTQKSETTTKKETTTAKPTTTTKKETTTKAPSKCTNNNHSLDCGNMGKWFSSKSDLKAYASSVMESYNSKYENGEISWDEYVKQCPCGYEAWSCSYCGKWTGNFKYN